MKTLTPFFFLFSLSILCLVFAACNQDEDVTIEIENLPGYWVSQHLEVNNIEWRELTGSPPARHLGINENGGYYLNYVTGNWAVQDQTLSLTHGYAESITDEYQILYLSSDSLVLESYLTEEDLLWNLSQFEEDEILTVVERFSR